MTFLTDLSADVTYGILCAWAEALVAPRTWLDELGDVATRHGILITERSA